MAIVDQLNKIGQSLWYDNIQRSQLKDGSLKKMIDQGIIKGVTSNPSIFQKSISTSIDYDETLKPMAWSGFSSEEIFWQLAIEDIQKTADLLRITYETSGFIDGFVSLEVSPYFAHDSKKTTQQAKELWDKVKRPNLMIKIPATREGISAIREAVAAGINVNVTLIFSLKRYEEVMDAYLAGLEDRVRNGQPIDRINSVASFFVSRVDTKIDGMLAKLNESGNLQVPDYDRLIGRAAIANARLAYNHYQKLIKSSRFLALAQRGARMQRPLWASTSTKNPQYRDVIYVEQLIGENTVNTVPPATLDAFLEHGVVANTISLNMEEAGGIFAELAKVGVAIDQVTDSLETEGVKAFSDAFTGLLEVIDARKNQAQSELGDLKHLVIDQVKELKQEQFIERFFAKDASLWTSDPAGMKEIQNRMNWVNAPVENLKLLPSLATLLQECQDRGLQKVVVLGMGGSSLAPEVFSIMFKEHSKQTGLEVAILDSTDPEQVLSIQKSSPLEKTLFIVASKSGTTGEINAFSEYFWQLANNQLGSKAAGHFVVITDPGSPLEKLAIERGYWKIFAGDPQVGGRYSVLTAFGLVPAALAGIDLDRLLQNASRMAEYCSPHQLIEANPGVVLGAYIGSGTENGRNKLTILTDPDWAPFGNWLEQLIAESSGKIGKGITPVVNEPHLAPVDYPKDRLFVYLRSTGDQEDFACKLREAGQPVLTLGVHEPYDLGAQFYLWEVATPVACSILGVNVFDQPDVQDAKTRTLRSIAEYKQNGKLIEPQPKITIDGINVFLDQDDDLGKSPSIKEMIQTFLSKNLKSGDYVAINAFLPMTPTNEQHLLKLRGLILHTHKVATMLGFGPRFLHSTGQLHKGGPDEGVFIVLTARRSEDIDIPGEGLSFGTMQRAQAIGDMDALHARNRRMIWIDLPDTGDSVSKIY